LSSPTSASPLFHKPNNAAVGRIERRVEERPVEADVAGDLVHHAFERVVF